MKENKSKSLGAAQAPSRRGFLLGSAGASGLAAAALVVPAKAADAGLSALPPKGTGVSAGNLSEHARKYYRSTTI